MSRVSLVVGPCPVTSDSRLSSPGDVPGSDRPQCRAQCIMEIDWGVHPHRRSAYRGTPMKVVIAPDKFKGSLSATQAAEAIARGLLAAVPDAVIDLVPMADGGEGTVDALVDATHGS